jgi:hypothetical protein
MFAAGISATSVLWRRSGSPGSPTYPAHIHGNGFGAHGKTASCRRIVRESHHHRAESALAEPLIEDAARLPDQGPPRYTRAAELCPPEESQCAPRPPLLDRSPADISDTDRPSD